MGKSRSTSRKKVQGRDFDLTELKILRMCVADDRFRFSQEDLEKVLDETTPNSSNYHYRAEVAIKKVKKMSKAHHKKESQSKINAQQAMKDPMPRGEAHQLFMRSEEGEDLAHMTRVLLDICIKNKLVTEKGFDKLLQERILKVKHPDPCPQCKGYDPEVKKGKLPCILTGELHKPTLAKERFPTLTGGKALQVIGCESYDYDANQEIEEPKDEKKNDGKEVPQDNS